MAYEKKKYSFNELERNDLESAPSLDLPELIVYNKC